MRTMIAVAALLVVVLCCGCGPKRKPVYPVRGKVFLAGQPTEGALVIFHPVDDPDVPPLRPSGTVAADGSFTLSSYVLKDGAPVGEYRVTILWVPELSTNPNAPDKLQGRYADPKTSGLRAQVKAEPNELPPFELKSKK